MGKYRRIGIVAALTVALGCREKVRGDAKPIAAPSASPAPVDHLAKGELLESGEKALTLPVPRGMHVDHAFREAVYLSGPVSPEDLANFVRSRVREGTVTSGASATMFEGVRVAAAPDKVLNIRVSRSDTSLDGSLTVTDVTPGPAVNLPDEASRWRAAGLTPSGELLDPKNLQ